MTADSTVHGITVNRHPDRATYRTLDGELLNLTSLCEEESAFLERVLSAHRRHMPWETFVNEVAPDNPALEPGRRVTRAVMNHPLYRAVRDIQDRLGIIHGELLPSDGDEESAYDNPIEDSWLSVTEAAGLKGVTPVAIRAAIERGEVIATKSRLQKVSQRSLTNWEPNKVRQRAGATRHSS